MKLSLGLSPRDYSVAGGAVAYDTDAQAYFTANTAITSNADKNAINTFYLGLKSDGIYNKIKAMYFPIWGSAATCKWNLKDPRDLDAAFRLTFHGTSWAFSSGGMTPTNAYANTYLNPNTAYSVSNNGHLSYYSRTDSNGANEREMGSLTSTVYTDIALRYSGTAHARWGETVTPITTTSANSLGFYINSRTSSISLKLFKNGSQIISSSQTGNSRPTVNFYLGALNQNNTAIFFSSKQCAFSSIGDGLTDTEAANFNTRVNTLMTYFGINV